MPVPNVSFVAREPDASASLLNTASYIPSKYNGYKVYGDDVARLPLKQ